VDKQNGPAMTYSIFSVISSRLGNSGQAYHISAGICSKQACAFRWCCGTATSDNPYFATGAGGMLQAVLYGFAGLNISDMDLPPLKPNYQLMEENNCNGSRQRPQTFSVAHRYLRLITYYLLLTT